MSEGGGSGGPENGPGPKSAAKVEATGGRLRFTVDLTAGETTVVSWKKLLKEANVSEPGPAVPTVSGPCFEARSSSVPAPLPPPAPAATTHTKQTTEKEPTESQAQDGSSRLSNVIERIERLYAGDGSSDEGDLILDNMPDDDEYDTDDSFIDDAELDEYFQVDNSAIKHDGFFVNRGKLEHIESITLSMNQLPQKRTHKDLAQGGGSDDGHNPLKTTKMGIKGSKTSSSIPRSSTKQFYKESIPSVDMPIQHSPEDPTELSKNMTAVIQVAMDPSGLQKGESIRQDMYKDQQISGVNPSEKHISKMKGIDSLDLPIQQKEKGGLVERLDLVAASSRAPLPVGESPMQGKEGSSVSPKLTNLEKAFGELEKLVAQLRPPSTESQDPANQSQAVKRRLTSDIKLKLAKVVRIAQSNYGGIPADVIDRLMSILGHLMRLSTLKRNLRAMTKRGLSAKREKDDQIHKLKQEVAEMVKLQTVHILSKLEQHGANSDDFQEADPVESLKHKYSMDDMLENKICDLYDLYVERLEEDSGPSVRRLYEELVLLWPSGIMNTDGIRRAIYRAKDRKGLCSSHKDLEKMKKKRVAAPEAQAAPNVTQATNTPGKLVLREPGTLVCNPVPRGKLIVHPVSSAARVRAVPQAQMALRNFFSNRGSTLVSNPVPSAARVPVVPQAPVTPKNFLSPDSGSTLVSNPVPSAVRLPVALNVPSSYNPNLDMSKQEKMKKSISSSNPNPPDVNPSDVLPKKNLKNKSDAEVSEAKLGFEKLML